MEVFLFHTYRLCKRNKSTIGYAALFFNKTLQRLQLSGILSVCEIFINSYYYLGGNSIQLRCRTMNSKNI